MKMRYFGIALGASLCTSITASHSQLPGAASFTVPSAFPTSVYSSYYVQAGPTSEPQPALYDPILNITYPFNLTDPKSVPTANNDDPVLYPEPLQSLDTLTSEAQISYAVAEVKRIINGDRSIQGNCSKCLAALSIGKLVAETAPTYLPDALVKLCKDTTFESNLSCEHKYTATSYGAVWAQVLALADVTGLDGIYICSYLSTHFCPPPTASPLNITSLFPKPKPRNATAPKPSGKLAKVIHLSDFHLDPRYEVASEANCSVSMCCRYTAMAASQPATFPAPLYGAYKCDSPYYLGLAALQSVAALTGTGTTHSSPAWTVHTGDLLAHDQQVQMSRAYLDYTEMSLFEMIRSYISGPVYTSLGNHDSSPLGINSQQSLPGPLGQQSSWHYEHVSSLWEYEGWLNSSEAQQAATHYSAYSVKNAYGLRIISLNTDFWSSRNIFNFINTTNPDSSGTFTFLIRELQAAEDSGERVWIIGHILPGWEGANGLPDPTDLFYQIVDRYSPHVIANIFFGHTHEDEITIYYTNNATVMDADTAIVPGWIGPSVAPLTNLNSGFRMYEVDTTTFDVYEAYTFYSDVSTFPNLTTTGPIFEFEYSTRAAYGPSIAWPDSAPLNATFWHLVTEAMERDPTLVEKFNNYQGKLSKRSPECTAKECQEAKVCYMRSGSAPLGRQCERGWSSVQSPYYGEDNRDTRDGGRTGEDAPDLHD